MIRALYEKLQKGQIKSVDLVQSYLANIESKDKEVQAFLQVESAEALSLAFEVDNLRAKGQGLDILAGIPWAVKDNISRAGKITSAGSKILENYKAPFSATVINKLKKSKAICLGRVNMDEFAMGSSIENSAYKITKNPYDLARVPGGSSGGSAAAVASEMAVWALGSDTGGSVRTPAAFCGLVGLKPTYGRVSRSGLIAMASSYDQIGPLAKTVEDVAIILDAISGKDPLDNTTVQRPEMESFYQNLDANLAGKKIGYAEDFFGDGLDEDIKKAIEEKIQYAKKQGAEIVKIELPYIKYALPVYYMMITSEISSNMARFDGIKYGFSEALKKPSRSNNILDVYKYSRQEGLGAEVKRRIILGTYVLSAGYYDAYYKKAQKVRELIKHDFKKAFSQCDAIIAPVTTTPAFKIGEKMDDPLKMYLADIYTVTANVAAIPAISIPCGFVKRDGKDLPIGLQILGKWWDDQTVLNVAQGLE